MKRVVVSLTLAIALLLMAVVPALAVYYVWISVTESLGNNYTALAMNMTFDVETLVDEDFITTTGLDTRVTDSDLNVLPHMLAEDRLLWVSDLGANRTTQFIFWAGQDALGSFYTITGYDGYVTINDTASIEPGDKYMFQILAYFDTNAGANKSIIRKDNAVVFNVTAYQELTFAVTGGNTLVLTGVTPGFHTIGVYCDGTELWAEVDDVLKDTTGACAIPNTANDWYLFENNVCPYVYYYDEWIVET